MRAILFVGVVVLLLATPSHAQIEPDPTDMDADGQAGVRPAPPPGADSPEVNGLRGTGRMLVDRSHLETFDVSGFTNFLVSQGWVVNQLQTGPITQAVLAPYDIMMVPVGTGGIASFSSAEVTAIRAYVTAGGGLWLFHDYLNATFGINSLATGFGVSFANDYVTDPTNNEGQTFWPTIYMLANHAVAQGIESYGYYAGCCLHVSAPAFLVASGDADAFSATCPSFPPVLATYESGGRVVFSGDNTPLYPSYYPGGLRAEERLLLQNIVNWLGRLLPTATEPTSWGQIKGLYR